jgi:hypothetical protein
MDAVIRFSKLPSLSIVIVPRVESLLICVGAKLGPMLRDTCSRNVEKHT